MRRRELLTWGDVDKLIDHLIPQFDVEFNSMIIITRGGIIPGGMICEALDLPLVMNAAVDFPPAQQGLSHRLLAWPQFVQFPDDEQIKDRKILVVDDVWGSGRTITAVKNRVAAAGGNVHTCVMHYNPYRSLFSPLEPDYYAAITDAYIIYPWEVNRGPDRVLLDEPE